jgi:hypothetical protein
MFGSESDSGLLPRTLEGIWGRVATIVEEAGAADLGAPTLQASCVEVCVYARQYTPSYCTRRLHSPLLGYKHFQ